MAEIGIGGELVPKTMAKKIAKAEYVYDPNQSGKKQSEINEELYNKIPLVKVISVIFSTEASFPTSEEIQQLLDMPAQDFARYGSKYQYYFYLKKEQKYYFIPAAYYKDDANGITIRGIDDIAELYFHQDYSNGVLSFSEKQAPDLSNYYTKEEVNTLFDGKIDTTLKGAKNGVASLDSTGKVPASQLPSYVDDVLEGYLDDYPLVESFSELNSYHAGEIVLYLGTMYRFKVDHEPGIFTPGEVQKIEQFPQIGEVGKIYSDIFTSKTYRWSGSAYTQIKGDLVIGTTRGTAFDGAAGAALQTQVTGKVDKETGKGLSSNDYTNDEKQKVADALVPADIAGKANASDVYTKEETYSKTEVHDLITTPNQEYVSVIATAQTTAVTDLLPATGAADTIYRVGNWDGTQYNDSVFSEYAWNGSAYIKLSTKSQIGEVYDISANHADTKYADLAAALGANGANIPQSIRKGGMSIKFVQSSDNKYIQARCMAQNFTTDVTQWQSTTNEVKAGSKDLVESGGVYAQIGEYIEEYINYPFSEGAYIDKDTGAETSYWNGTCTDYIAAELGDTFELLVTEDYNNQQLVIYGYDSSKQPVKLLYSQNFDASIPKTASIGDSDIAYVRAGSNNKPIISGFRKENNKSIDKIYSDTSALSGKTIEDLENGSGTSGYIKNDGSVVTPYTGYEYKEYSVTAGSRISLLSYLITNMCAIAKKNSDGTYTPLVQSDNSTTYKIYIYTYTCTENCTIVVSYGIPDSTSGVNCQIKIESDVIAGLQEGVEKALSETAAIDGKIDEKFSEAGISSSTHDDLTQDTIEGHYISSDGGISNNDTYAYKLIDVLAGSLITLKAFTQPQVAAIAEKFSDTQFTPLVVTTVGYKVDTLTYTATKNMTIAVSFRPDNQHILDIVVNNVNSNTTNIENLLASEADDNQERLIQDIEYGFMFDKIAVIGDSLASGRVEGIVGQPDAVGADYLSFSWLQLLAKRWRCSTALNYSNAGATTASWISTWLPVMQVDSTVCDIYFIALGTNNEYNESNPGGDQENYEAFVDRYNDIIDAVRTKAPNAAIILMSLYEKRAGNAALEEIAEERMQTDDGIYYLDYANNAKYLRYSLETNWRGHFSSTGYVYAASAINQILNDIIWENKTKEFWQQFAKNHNYVQPIPTT